ncbi:MAG: DegT/DnrJ/EryC1/StrS family aminotransferase [Bacteroidales bacterium]
MKVPFSPPRIDKLIEDAVLETLRSGWITTGPKTREFEKLITAYAGHKATLCLNSATSGLELMLRWFGIGEGDEVIIPAYTYTATASVVLHCGARPVMVDCGSDFNISIPSVRRAITERTKVIIPVDIAGWPCDYDALNSMVREENVISLFVPSSENQEKLGRILILSDAAHSIGATFKDKRSGALTDISVFSFHAVKNLTTAEGGAVCLNLPQAFDNEEEYRQLVIKSLHGQTKDAMAKLQPGNWRYDIIEAGYKYNMTDIQAAMGIVELRRYDNDMLVKRRHIFERYSKTFSRYPWAQIPEVENTDKISSFHVYLLRINGITETQRDQIINGIFESEVAVNVHFVPLPLFTCYKSLGYLMADYPSAWDNYSREISLPVYYDLTDEMVDYVIQSVIHAVNHVLR